MKNNLQKKHGFFELYKRYILYFCNICMFIIFFIIALFLLKNIVLWIKDFGVVKIISLFNILKEYIGQYSPNQIALFFLNISYILLFLNILIWLSLWLLKIKRQMYLPLTIDELKANNIKNIKEYSLFLEKFLHKMKPNPYLMEKISKTIILFCDDKNGNPYDDSLKLEIKTNDENYNLNIIDTFENIECCLFPLEFLGRHIYKNVFFLISIFTFLTAYTFLYEPAGFCILIFFYLMLFILSFSMVIDSRWGF